MKRVLRYLCRFLFREYPIHLLMLFTAFLPQTGWATRIRGMLIAPFIGKCGRGLKIASGVVIGNPAKLTLGDNVYLAHYVWINATGGLEIGSDSIVGPFCVIATSRHKFQNGMVTHNGAYRPVRIGRGVWLASHVVVTDGVTIGDGVLAAAGTVITHDVPQGTIIAGIPGTVKGTPKND